MYNKLLMLSFYSLILNAFFRPLNSSIAIIFGYITIFLAFLYPIVRSRYNGKMLIGRIPFIFVCILLLSMVCSVGYFTTKDLDNQIIAIVSFITLYWSLSFHKRNTNTANVLYIQDLCKANYFLCAVLLLFGFGPFSFKYMEVDAWGNKVFSMGLGNPNVVSVYVMFAIMLLLIDLVVKTRTIFKIIDLLIIAALLYLLIMLSSRTVVACVLLLLLGYFLGKKSNKMQFLWWLVIAWPLVMIFITMILGESNSAVQLLGKTLDTGRYNMYTTTITEIRDFPLSFVVGQVFKYRFSNMHNAPLTIITNIGLVGLIVYLVFWYSEIKKLSKCCDSKVQRIAFYAMLAFIIQSSSESLSMVGTIPYSIMVIIVDKIANGEIVDRKSLLPRRED